MLHLFLNFPKEGDITAILEQINIIDNSQRKYDLASTFLTLIDKNKADMTDDEFDDYLEGIHLQFVKKIRWNTKRK